MLVGSKEENTEDIEFFKKVDVYALGILFYYLVQSKLPYPEYVKTLEDLTKYVLNNQVKLVSKYPKIDYLVNMMITKDFKQRWNINSVKEYFDTELL